MTPKPEMPKPDKYDEAAKYCDEKAHADYPTWQRQRLIKEYLQEAFPSAPSDAESAEDALECVERIEPLIEQWFPEDDKMICFRKAAAELEAFASARTAPWRNVVNDILAAVSWHRIPPTVLEQARKLLSDSPAKEDAK